MPDPVAKSGIEWGEFHVETTLRVNLNLKKFWLIIQIFN